MKMVKQDKNRRYLKRWMSSVCIAIMAFFAFIIASRVNAETSETVTIDSVPIVSKSPYVDEATPASFEEDRLNSI